MDAETFESIVLEALNTLPPEFARYLENVEIQIESRPTHEHRRAVGLKPWQTLYGLYQGVPLTVRSSSALLMPDLIISSDATRARLTAEAMADAAGYEGTILLERRLYHASPPEIVDLLHSVVDAELETVMIVGHNPGLEELVAKLTGAPEDVPTAALAQIELPIERWSNLTATTRGTLVGMWRPRDLE